MDQHLTAILEIEYPQALEARAADMTEAELARAAGDMPHAFDASIHMALADVCWSLEMWDEARRLYRHNADVMVERRAWHQAHSPAGYPLNASIDWEASTFVKAGRLELGQKYLRPAIEQRRGQRGSELVLARLALHAAQAGLPDLAQNAHAAVAARSTLPGNETTECTRARALLHYEPAEAQLLLGRWKEFDLELERLEEGVRLAEHSFLYIYPPSLQEALTEAARGLRAIASLLAVPGRSMHLANSAREAFEAAMTNFYQFNGWVDTDLYFMRLNATFAEQLASGQPINPNPFSDEPPKNCRA